MKKHIPNLVTLLNLFCGCVAILFAVQNYFLIAICFVCIGIFFDFFDGLLARKLNVQSPLGVQLDSLSDLVTSGVVPGIIMYKLIETAVGGDTAFVVNNGWNQTFNWQGAKLTPIALIGFLIPLASAYRLAYFNIDDEQQSFFKGLPVPANTLLIISLPLILHYQYSITVANLFANHWFLIALTMLSCYLLNCNIKLFAFKFKSWSFRPNLARYLFIGLSVFLLIMFKFIGVPILIACYILISVLNQKSIS